VIKKPRTRGGYSPARGLQNTNPQWVVAPVKIKKKIKKLIFIEEMWKGAAVAYCEVLFRHFLGKPEENHETSQP
jgi:hypothetical protein